MDTWLPFGYGYSFGTISGLIGLADLFGCSLDVLLCREHPGCTLDVLLCREYPGCLDLVPESGTSWQTGDPVNLGEYVLLFGPRPGATHKRAEIWTWTGCSWADYGMDYDEAYDGKILGWMPLPED